MKKLTELKTMINSLINKESSKEAIDQVAQINSLLDEADKEDQEQQKELAAIKDDYINLIRTSGDKRPPLDPNEGDQPKTLEELAEEIVTSRNDNK